MRAEGRRESQIKWHLQTDIYKVTNTQYLLPHTPAWHHGDVCSHNLGLLLVGWGPKYTLHRELLETSPRRGTEQCRLTCQCDSWGRWRTEHRKLICDQIKSCCLQSIDYMLPKLISVLTLNIEHSKFVLHPYCLHFSRRMQNNIFA